MSGPAKPGWKTTEFWLSLAAQMVGVLAASGAIATGSIWERMVGVVATALASMGYSVSRAKVKSS